MRGHDDERDRFRRKVEGWVRRLKVAPKVIRVQRMTRKWGSCSTSGVVTFAADLIEEEAGFQDYVIVHELLHLRVPNHGRLFKALLTVHLPGWRARDIERFGRTRGRNRP